MMPPRTSAGGRWASDINDGGAGRVPARDRGADLQLCSTVSLRHSGCMSQTSPYTPGEVAKSVPGRATQLAFYDETAERIALLGNFIGRVRVEHAARGVGKTSLLREAQRRFENHGIATVWVTANEDEKLLPSILEALRDKLPLAQRKAADLIDLIDSVSLSLGAGPVKGSLTLKTGGVAAASAAKAFISAVKKVADVLVASGAKGVVIFIDEVQSADKPSLRALAQGWQELGSDEDAPPAGLFCVGLPGSEDHLTSAATFSERFDFQPLVGIGELGATAALLTPAQDLGVSWDQDALRMAVDASDGYAYKVQLVGEATWTAAGSPDAGARIVPTHVADALPNVARRMQTLFATRWRSASVKQREFMIALAELGGIDVKREDVAARLGVESMALGVPRDKLLQRGLIEASGHGRLSFTLPGFAAYALDQS
jgi:hypothetical protein